MVISYRAVDDIINATLQYYDNMNILPFVKIATLKISFTRLYTRFIQRQY